MDANLEATAALRSGCSYEIRPAAGLDGFVVVDQAQQPAMVIGLTGKAWTATGGLVWSVTRERLGWRLVLRSESNELLRVAPRGEVIKYRMSASGRLVCKLRQNLFTRRWRLYRGTESLARIEVSQLFLQAGLSDGPDRLAGYLDVGSRLPNEPMRSACLICALLCVRFDAGYAIGTGAAG